MESDVIQNALEMKTDEFSRSLSYKSIPKTQLEAAGLTCGGELDVLICRPRGEDWTEFLASPPPRSVAVSLIDGRSRMCEANAALALATETELQITQPALDRLMIFGASHISTSLVRFARDLDFQVTVADPRTIYLNPERFPVMPDFFVPMWPDQAYECFPITASTYVVTLSHDDKIDVAALRGALRSEATYIGALGSVQTHENRKAQLLEDGFTPNEIDRIHGPVGLSIGARSAEEIALSIIAEIVQVRRSKALTHYAAISPLSPHK